MNKKMILICVLISCSYLLPAHAARVGLTQKIYTRYLKYSFQPKDRAVFKSGGFGHQDKFKEINMRILRDRVTPMLDHFKETYNFSIKNNTPLMNYDPRLKVQGISDSTLANLSSISYPANLKWIARDTSSRGLEFIELSFQKKPSAVQYMNIINSLERVLKLNLKRKELQNTKTRKRLSKIEKEMLEPIKLKTMTLRKYQTYYGIQYQFADYVHGEYFSDLKETLKADFTEVQQRIKSYFYRSKEINMAINSKIITNLEESIESADFDSLSEPFVMPITKLPKKFYRFSKTTSISRLSFLFSKKEDSESMLPTIKSMIDKL